MSRRQVVVTAVIGALLVAPIWLSSTAGGGTPRLSAGPPTVLSEAHHDLSQPLRSIPPAKPLPRSGDEVENEIPRVVRVPGGPDAALQPHNLSTPVAGPTPLLSFAGAQNTDNATLVFPPDTNGDVGPNNYVQVVNLTFTIFNKSGAKLLGPSPTNTIWSGFGGLCQTHNDGDPVVLYDQLADRWLISQFAITTTTSHECIAISQTSDPTGAWFRYDFPYSNTLLNDYPKFGVWPDAYYMSANQFTLSTSTFSGSGVVAYERARMLQGLSARAVYIDLNGSSATSTFSGLLPADVDGSTPPPNGAPNHYLTLQGTSLGDPADRLQQWDFHVDWTTPSNSSFTQAAVLPVAAFNANMCNFARNCIAQSGTTAKLDAISDRLMFRNAYRNFGTYEAEVVNHTVNVGANQGAVRWYEVRNTSTSPTLFQQGTYAGDSANTQSRWMGSAALDANGDIAVGYSDSNSAVHPSIRYTGRLVGDPLGTLPQGETTLITGAGSQTVANSRWGDYSNLSVDPSDGCTFWYTQEYYAATGTNWQTRVGSFKFPSCGSSPAPPVNTSVPTVSGSAVQGSTLTASPGVWTGSPAPSFTYQWQRCDSGGANCGDVVGQTATTYLLGGPDLGKTLRVVVTGTNASGFASANSAVTAVVVAGSGIGPTTPVLDNFNRANGGAGANWSLIRPSGFAGLNVSGNAAVDASATLFAWDYWNPASFGPDTEAYVTVANYGASDTIRLGARASNVGTTSQSGYYVAIASTGVWSILRIDAGVSATLATGPTQPLASGDKIAIRIVGPLITALHFSGGNWQQVMSYDTSGDATKYNAAGRLAVELKTSTLDDFGGGTLSGGGGTPPVNTLAPSVSGTTTVGQQLTASPGTWTGSPAPTFTYQWLRCNSGGGACAPISSQTAQTYTLAPADAGLTVAVTVTGTNTSGFSSAGSQPVGPIASGNSPPANTSLPTISGSAVQGQTLTASPGVWTGSPAPTFTYQWQRCDSGGGSCGDVVGQTATTYLLGGPDVGSTLKVAVTGTNGSGFASATSAATAVVVANSGVGPTTPILDNFNRANGGAGANWSLIRPTGFAALNVSGNTVIDASATLFAWDFWNASSFGPNAEAYVTVANYGASDTIRLGARVSNAGTTSQSGYYAAISSAGAWSILRVDAGVPTTLATGPTQALASGHRIAIQVVGTVITALHFSGGSWQQVISYDTSGDATKYSAAGRLAVEFRSSTLDDFGGGSLP